ncbi:MAG TPA: hypothetical protein VF647_15460 [Longimicrobium sp.]|jgi:hypothetical protein
MNIPDVAVGAIVAATITGLLSLLGLIIAKEQKVSEFRQAWIDALRSELAELLGHINAMYQGEAILTDDPAGRWTRVREDYVGANKNISSIRLRLNPKESEDILKTLSDLETAFNSRKPLMHLDLVQLEKNLLDQAKLLLKTEWIRVRKGEIVYRVARATALAVVCVCLISIAAYLASMWVPR